MAFSKRRVFSFSIDVSGRPFQNRPKRVIFEHLTVFRVNMAFWEYCQISMGDSGSILHGYSEYGKYGKSPKNTVFDPLEPLLRVPIEVLVEGSLFPKNGVF